MLSCLRLAQLPASATLDVNSRQVLYGSASTCFLQSQRPCCGSGSSSSSCPSRPRLRRSSCLHVALDQSTGIAVLVLATCIRQSRRYKSIRLTKRHALSSLQTALFVGRLPTTILAAVTDPHLSTSSSDDGSSADALADVERQKVERIDSVQNDLIKDGVDESSICFGAKDVELLHFVGEKLQSLVSDDVKFQGVVLEAESNAASHMLRCLQNDDVDFVAMSVKDLPLDLPTDLHIAAVLPRQAFQEALAVHISKRDVALEDLGVIWVPSLRRRLQLAARYPQLRLVRATSPLAVRLRRLHAGDVDGVVASTASLLRQSLGEASILTLEIDDVMPAFGQGAIAFVCHSEDEDLCSFLKLWDDRNTRSCIFIEREIQNRLQQLPAGVAASGFAQLANEDQLLIRASIVSTVGMARCERSGRLDEADDLIFSLTEELMASIPTSPGPEDDMTVESLLMGQSLASQGELDDLQIPEVEDEDLENDTNVHANAEQVTIPPIFGTTTRLAAAEVDCTGRTPYVGRVCGMLTGSNEGLILDINSDVPALLYPEISSSSEASSSSQPSSSSDTPSSSSTATGFIPKDWKFKPGDELEVYCCLRAPSHFRVLVEAPPRLVVRGGLAPLRLSEMKSGMGPLRAVVISSTSAGTLVDFNCEAPGLLLSSQSHQRGEELRVYSYKFDVANGIWTVGTQRESPWNEPARRTLADVSLMTTDIVCRGTVRKVTGSGVFVDFNCEVQGYIGPMDIDIEAWPSGLATGHEVTVYVKAVDFAKRQVRVTMFRPPTGRSVRILGSGGSSNMTKI